MSQTHAVFQCTAINITLRGSRLPRVIKKLQTKGQKEPGETIEETTGCVRMERENKWSNSIIVDVDNDDDDEL